MESGRFRLRISEIDTTTETGGSISAKVLAGHRTIREIGHDLGKVDDVRVTAVSGLVRTPRSGSLMDWAVKNQVKKLLSCGVGSMSPARGDLRERHREDST
jgi:hypothetical protein